jgi:hypothetical protein
MIKFQETLIQQFYFIFPIGFQHCGHWTQCLWWYQGAFVFSIWWTLLHVSHFFCLIYIYNIYFCIHYLQYFNIMSSWHKEYYVTIQFKHFIILVFYLHYFSSTILFAKNCTYNFHYQKFRAYLYLVFDW